MLYQIVIGLTLVILFKLAAELAFLFGLYAKTQARAVTYGVSVFAAMSFLPVVVRIGIREIWARDLLYLSPIADLLVSEFPPLGVEWGHPSTNWLGIRTAEWQFYPLLHCALYAVIVLVLAGVNRHLAAGVLLRPKRQRTPSHPCVARRRWPIRRPQCDSCATPRWLRTRRNRKRRPSLTAELWYAPLSYYFTRVKGVARRRGFFCGRFPFFAPQKNQKNRGFVQKLFSRASWTLSQGDEN